jgi:hypothetical protein
MSRLEKKLLYYADQAKHIPRSVAKIVRNTVVENVSEYLDTLANISSDEELKMMQRKPRQSDLNENKKYRDRVNSFKNLNREVKQETGQEIVDEDTLGVPLKTALIDDSILQLYKLANEIALLIKSGKIDGPNLTILVEKAIDNVTRKTTNNEVKNMMSDLVSQVEAKYKILVLNDIEKEKENYFKELSTKLNKIQLKGK